jgi:sodium-dependent phosphate transporter
VLMLAMGCAEVGNAVWLMVATRLGMPVSTTQTIVGALCGVGFATQSAITWGWEDGSVSQVAASWAIAPLIAAGFSAVIFLTVKYLILERKDPFKWAMRLIPFYMAATAAILTLFLAMEVPSSTIDEGGPLAGLVLGIFAGALLFAYVFFIPFFKRKLIMEDSTVRIWHIFYGPLLLKENTKLMWPGEKGELVADPYETAYNGETRDEAGRTTDEEKAGKGEDAIAVAPKNNKKPEPEERWLHPVKELSWFNPKKWLNWAKYLFLQGVCRDVISHDSANLRAVHGKAKQYDLKVEHMFTYCQVVSAMMMSIAHGSNDVANAVGPWAAVYQTYLSGQIDTTSATPIWFLVVAGLLLGIGFWCYGHRIIRAVGNSITQMSPTRGFSIELGAAVTVLLASKLGLPVSTTQCLVGASMGVGISSSLSLSAVNWRQLGFIFMGWVVTLPAAGLMAGLICLMALNTPHF